MLYSPIHLCKQKIKTMNIKRAILATLMVWIFGVVAFITSFSIPLLEDPMLQANLVLVMALIPATMLGARFYYKGGLLTHGLALGAFMFGITILLDGAITVPLFIIPEGGDHISFFADPWFWLIGLMYVSVVTLYWGIKIKPIQKLNAV